MCVFKPNKLLIIIDLSSCHSLFDSRKAVTLRWSHYEFKLWLTRKRKKKFQVFFHCHLLSSIWCLFSRVTRKEIFLRWGLWVFFFYQIEYIKSVLLLYYVRWLHSGNELGCFNVKDQDNCSVLLSCSMIFTKWEQNLAVSISYRIT